MENKARSYESPFLAAIFLMNNYNFVHKTFTRSVSILWQPLDSDNPYWIWTMGLDKADGVPVSHFLPLSRNTLMLELMEDVSKDIDDHYLSMVTTQARAYQRGWETLCQLKYNALFRNTFSLFELSIDSFTKLIGFLGLELTYASGGSEKVS